MTPARAFLLAAVCLAVATAAVGAEGISITEILASNGDGITDADGDRSDWIELRNSGRTPARLAGWSLTDDSRDLAKWRFPDVTIEPGGFLVVFASGKERRDPGGELHTNFQLEADGEFLALVGPDGTTVGSAFSPSYPPQRTDVSYGIEQETSVAPFVGPETPARVWIPSDGVADGVWFLPEFDDSAWLPATARLGYDAGDPGGPSPGAEVNLALRGTARQSSIGWEGSPSRAIDGNTNGNYGAGSVTHTAAGDPVPWWEVELERASALERIVLWNRTDCCSRRLSNFKVSVLDDERNEVFFALYFLDGFDFPTPGVGFDIPLPLGTEGRRVRVELLGPNADGELYLSLAEVKVFEGVRGYDHLIATDLEASMLGVRASAYVRAAFEVGDPAALGALTLRIRYDDGFVAYLNGREVARRNAPEGPLSFGSRAAAERPDAQAAVSERINLTGDLDALRSGRNVLAIHGLNLSPSDPDFLLAFELEAVSIREGEFRYFLEPTPGAPNAVRGFAGFVADTKFSADRGFYEEPFAVEISTETPGATIRWTADGSVPTETHGDLYEGPISIRTTTVLRAAAFKEGYAPTNVDTHTYIFPKDVVRQTGAGFPRTWGGTAADYEMDPEVVDDPRYRESIVHDLQTIPTLSIVMDVDDLFGPGGIYSNTEGRGDAWERPASMELIYPEDSRIAPAERSDFQTDCGIRIFGYGWRSHSATLKHAFRLMFKRKYGPAKLDFPFFPDWPVRRFDCIVLRSQGSRSWNDFRPSIQETQYIRDAWARYTAREMGKLTTSSTYVHLYLNGLYWGLYNPVERPDAEFMAEHLGGREEEYDALNARVGNIEVIDGSRAGWDELMELARSAADPRVYEAVRERADIADLIDYMLVQFYTCNQDWPGSNGNNLRVAGGPRRLGGYKSFLWDMEYSIWYATDNVLNVHTSYSSPAALYALLKANPEFRVEFGDRAHRHLFHGGALTPERAAARWMDRAREIDRAIVGESARWGDRRREPPYTRDVEWIREQKRLLETFFPQRTAILLSQLREAGLYPAIEAPAFSQEGGPFEPPLGLVMTAPAGEIFYTIDGTDPRLPGGAVSPRAERFGGDVELATLVPSRAEARVLVPRDGSLGLEWTRLDFDDAHWLAGRTGVGFDVGTAYADLIETDVEAAMYGLSSSVYIRISFDAGPSFFEGGAPAVGALYLDVKYDDGFAAYLNGAPVASRNAPASPDWTSRATSSHADNLAVVLERVDISASSGLLRPGRNVLAIHGLNASPSNGDLLILPELAVGAGAPRIVLEGPAIVKARARANGSWSALAEAFFWVETPLRVAEILYHPPDPAGPYAADDFEFLELKNVGERTLDLAGIRLAGGVEFEFADGAVRWLAKGALVVVVRDLAAFRSRYGEAGIPLAGEYAGNLSNAGELVRIEGPFGETILEFRYEDSWYPSTDGGGHSLVHVDPRAGRETWSSRSGWRPSDALLGTPGVDDSEPRPQGGGQIPGDLTQDGELNISDAIALLGFLFLGAGETLPCGDGSLEDEGNRLLLDSTGDGAVDIADAVYTLNYLFLGGMNPALGTSCVRIAGCREVCSP